MSMGKCPKCEKTVLYATIERIESRVPLGGSFKAISHQCPSCRTILGVEVDPLALKTDIINGLMKKLGRS